MAGGEDDAAAGLVLYHGHFNGWGGGKVAVDHINTEALQGGGGKGCYYRPAGPPVPANDHFGSCAAFQKPGTVTGYVSYNVFRRNTTLSSC